MYRCTNLAGAGEPEAHYRIVHVTQQDINDSAPYLQRDGRVRLGAQGSLRERQYQHLDSPRDHRPGRERRPRRPGASPCGPGSPRQPGGTEPLRKAIEWRGLLDAGEISCPADIARREGLTRGRVTQVMGLLCLVPEIQEHILLLPKTHRRLAVTEHSLRPIARIRNTREQVGEFQKMLSLVEG